MLGGFGIWELLIILVIVMILFGAKRLPDLAKGLGQGINEFKKAHSGASDDANSTQQNSGTNATKNDTK